MRRTVRAKVTAMAITRTLRNTAIGLSILVLVCGFLLIEIISR